MKRTINCKGRERERKKKQALNVTASLNVSDEAGNAGFFNCCRS